MKYKTTIDLLNSRTKMVREPNKNHRACKLRFPFEKHQITNAISNETEIITLFYLCAVIIVLR